MTAVTSPDSIQGTTKELMARWGTEYNETMGFLTLLRKKGIVKVINTVKPAGGKGKPSIVYSVPNSINLNTTVITPAPPADETPAE